MILPKLPNVFTHSPALKINGIKSQTENTDCALVRITYYKARILVTGNGPLAKTITCQSDGSVFLVRQQN